MHGNETRDTQIEVQQGDTASRKVRIRLKTFGGADYIVPYGARAVLCIRKNDGKKVYDECEIEDKNVLLVTLSDQAISCSGLQKAQIYIFSEEGDIKTQVFQVNVPKAVYSDDAIESSDEFGILHELIVENSAIQQAEQMRIEAEATRTASEEERQANAATMATLTEACLAVIEDAGAVAYARGNAIVQTASGTSIVAQDGSDDPVRGLRLFGRTTQDGTPAPDAPVPLVSVGDAGSVTVSITGTDDNVQSLTLHTPNGLPGIPVTDESLANYTDADGQMWCADEKDYERGVYVKRVVRCRPIKTLTFVDTGIDGRKRAGGRVFGEEFAKANIPAMSNIAQWSAWGTGAEKTFALDNDAIYYKDSTKTCEEVNDMFAELGENFEVLGVLKTPIETPLTEDELAQYRSLHSNYLVTTLLNDSGAHMEVKYNADTKTYIDNKFAELKTALVALGGN